MTVRMKNFSLQATPSVVDTEYDHCNFTQAEPHTRIFPGDDTPRHFINCRLLNCDLPPGSTKESGTHAHEVLDPANDETVTIDGESILIPATKVEVVA